MWEKLQREEYTALRKTVSTALDFPQRGFWSVGMKWELIFRYISYLLQQCCGQMCNRHLLPSVAEGQWLQEPPLESASAQLWAYSQDGDTAVLCYILQQAASCVVLSKTEEKEEDLRQSRSQWRGPTVNHMG